MKLRLLHALSPTPASAYGPRLFGPHFCTLHNPDGEVLWPSSPLADASGHYSLGLGWMDEHGSVPNVIHAMLSTASKSTIRTPSACFVILVDSIITVW